MKRQRLPQARRRGGSRSPAARTADALEGPRRGDRRRLRRRDGGEVHPPVGSRRSTWCWSSATPASFPARSRTWCSPATRAWRRSAAATTACAATACRWCATKWSRSTRRARVGAARARRRHRLRAPDRLARHRLHLRRSAGLRGGDAGGRRAACVEGRAADRGAALPARGDARRRRLHPVGPAGALPLPAGTLRAREHGGRLLQAGEAALEGAGARRQSGRHLEGRRCSSAPGRISTRGSSSSAATRRSSASSAARYAPSSKPSAATC